MHLRPLDRADLSRLADFCLAANQQNNLTCFLNPHREAYPFSFRHSYLRGLSVATCMPGVVAWVAETDEHDGLGEEGGGGGGGGVVVGLALWERVGESEVARKWKRRGSSWGEKLDASLEGLRDKYYDFFGLEWSVDRARKKAAMGILHQPWDEEIFVDGWQLAGLVVAVDYQRKGVGAMLTKWGLEQAQAENVPVWVQSSEVGRAVYERCGFRAFERLPLDEVEGLVLKDQGMLRMVWEPSDRGELWEKAKEAAERRTGRALVILPGGADPLRLHG